VKHEHDGGRVGGRPADRIETGEGVRHATSFLEPNGGGPKTIVPPHGMIREMTEAPQERA
jgi:hypothetical protein